MPVDNDRTKGLALPFLILAHVRTGGTFCAHALSNHPQVYCDRGETLHHLSAWRKAHVSVGKIVETIWQRLVRQGALPYYPVHTFHRHTRRPVSVEPEVIVQNAMKVAREMAAGARRLSEFSGPVLEVTYEEMVGHGPATEMAEGVADQIERFLSVRAAPLPVDLQPDFLAPMAKWFTNWSEIRSALEAAGFGGLDG